MTEQPTTPPPPPYTTEPEPVKKSRKGTVITGAVALVAFMAGIVIGVAASGSSTPAPIAGPAPTVTATVEVPGPTQTVTATPEATTPAATTTCADVKEAFLTGTPAQIAQALKALVADKTAEPIAREYAKYWLGRDAGDKSMQSLDEGLIQSGCSNGLFQ